MLGRSALKQGRQGGGSGKGEQKQLEKRVRARARENSAELQLGLMHSGLGLAGQGAEFRATVI